MENVNIPKCKDLCTDEGFAYWLQTREGSKIAVQFVKAAQQLKSRGFTRYGAKAICEYIRFNHALKTGADGFKLNNNVTSRLARWAMVHYPDLNGFFSIRELKEREVK